MSEVPFKIRWLSGGVPDHWQIVEPRRIFKLVKEPERPGDVHLTPSQKYGVLPQEEYMKITGARVVQNLSGTQMQHVEPGDFISHLRTFQGGLELATIPGKVSPAYTVLRPTEAVYPGFFKHVLKSPGYVSQIASVTDQLRDGQTMRFNEFNLTWLPLPPLEEQKRIADELDRELAEIDEFIADQRRLQDLLQERLVSLTFDLATDASNPDRYETGHLFWKTLPKGWTLQKLGWHFRIGNGSTPSTENPDFWTDEDTGFPWFNSSIVNSDVALEPARFVTDKAIRECHLPFVSKDSLLVGLTGQGKNRGMVTKTGIDATINQHMAFLTPRKNSQLDVDFTNLTLTAAYPELRLLSDGNGGTKGALTCDELKHFMIPTLPKNIQLQKNDYYFKSAMKINKIQNEIGKSIIYLNQKQKSFTITLINQYR
ncbi:restriction endonuclease subunit S [Rothia terrae]|uniref:restriction endonuclease subunit S n=1 Tax=Rothia terrae TaxID=396015 RepID=UPI0028820948|nr:restriction endonuclease subunit S [Rothia terrae]MDT0188659.1 restriction endonuclease subunit S [Rothia terrae]